MRFRCILITGGAGFVGANLATLLRRDFPDVRVTALDNLQRRGGELNLPRLRAIGVDFVHGDIRNAADLDAAGDFDLLIDCAAEPSVHAGLAGSPWNVLDVNLVGSLRCFEAARRQNAPIVLLSTSRVYPIAALNAVPFEETNTRFRWTAEDAATRGISERGVAEQFPIDGVRSYYGASKLAAELILQEYAAHHGLPAVINRCGVLTGPWQMGKVDQGVAALWVARHYYGLPLRYTGFGGTGKQVRDLLHVEDLYDLIVRQCGRIDDLRGPVFNVGGGLEVSASLCELTDVCRRVVGREVPITGVAETSAVDLRIYVTDARRAQREFAWRPQRSVETIVSDLHAWLQANDAALRPIFT